MLTLLVGLLPLWSTGEQNLPPQLSLWQVDYFQWKTIKAQKTQKEILTDGRQAGLGLKGLRWRACPATQHHHRQLPRTEASLHPASARPSKHLFTKRLLFHLQVNCLPLEVPKHCRQHPLSLAGDAAQGEGCRHFDKLLVSPWVSPVCACCC